jgi:phage terminase small subunit
MGKKINDRQQQVILNYKANGGNMKKAMLDAGYSETYADRNSKYLMGIIGDDIKQKQDVIRNEKIKSVTQIQEFWSEVMDDADCVEMKDRLKASEMLAKSQGGFIEKIDMNAKVENPLSGLSTDDLKKLIDDD